MLALMISCAMKRAWSKFLYRQVYKLRTKEVVLVKVLWRNQFVEEVTWKAEEDMMKTYPDLIESVESTRPGDKALLSN